MANPEIISEQELTLVDAKTAVAAIEKRDEELGFLSQKAKEYLGTFVKISAKDKEALMEGLKGLSLTRLKHEHLVKIIDFLPANDEELKVILQAYPLTLPKKDKEAILTEVAKVK